ncbi:competence protein ComEA [Lachnospiraceae bacterium PF1-22]|uniref:helix-hairpin-helix domain-containing protein n=1 Tax=Ohessyouella blattaphilus TaxID=2949333 RepID=UPI003E240A72
MKKKRITIGLLIAGLALLLLACKKETKEEVIELSEVEAAEALPEEEPVPIFVHVCGQVINPGVYELEEGARVFEAIAVAGGVTDEGEASLLNLAEVLSDGMRLYVPKVDEAIAESGGAPGETLINLNTASKEELMSLSGIGEAKAEAIILYREETGKFTTIEELQEVSGIGESTFNRLKDKIKV